MPWYAGKCRSAAAKISSIFCPTQIARFILVWGSSYSAALVFLLAAEHQDEIKAILAFSPGEYLRGSSSRPEGSGAGFESDIRDLS